MTHLDEDDYILEDEMDINYEPALLLRAKRDGVDDEIERLIKDEVITPIANDRVLSRRRRVAGPPPEEEGSGETPTIQPKSTCDNTGSNFFCGRFARKGKCTQERAIAFSRCRSSCDLWYVDFNFFHIVELDRNV